MLDLKKSQMSSKYLASICKSNPSFFAKLTISANYQKRTPHFIDALLLTIEYLQLFSQFWLLNNNLYPQISSSSVYLPQVLSDLGRVLLPGGFFRSIVNKRTLLIMFLILVIFSILRIWLIVHVSDAARKGEKLRNQVAMVWNWFYHFSARVIYSAIVSFWNILIQIALRNTVQFDPFFRYCLITVPCVLMVFEVSVSIIIERSLSYNLPTKRFMSRKESTVETITLIQKIINQAFLISYVKLTKYAMTLSWFSNIINLGFCMLRDFYFFRNFPLYNIKALRYEACLLVLTTTQCLVYLIQTLLRVSYDEKIDPNFAVVTWMMLGAFGVFIANKIMKGALLKIAINIRGGLNSNLMIHKVFIMKYFYKNYKLPSHQNQNYSFEYLISQTLSIHSQTILNVESMNAEFGSKRPWNKFFVGYFEYLTEAFPKNQLIRLILAWFYIRKMGLYGPGIRILYSLINCKDKSAAFNASLLIYELEKELLMDYQSEKSKLDLGEYTKSTSAVINLKSLMLNQAKQQIELCSGVSQNRPDLNEIFKSAQNIYQAREKVERKIKKVFAIVPEYYMEPYKLCAFYNLSLNFSLQAYNNYEKLYSRISHKYNKFLSSKELTQVTLYNKHANVFLVSGAKASLGMISYSSKRFSKFIQNPITGTHIGALCPKSLRKTTALAINAMMEEGNKFCLERIEDSFYYNHSTLESFPMQSYMNIVPYFTEGLHYAVISIPSPLAYELITFMESGEIESYTPGIGRILNLTQSVRKGRFLNIASLNKELERMNDAFNMLRKLNNHEGIENSKTMIIGGENSLQKNGTRRISQKLSLTLEEAREISNLYLTEGEILSLKPISIYEKREDLYAYRCKVVEVTEGSSYFRHLMLEKTENNKAMPSQKVGVHSLMIDPYDSPSECVAEPSECNDDQVGNEKEAGWINPPVLYSPRAESLQKVKTEHPTSTAEQLMTSTRPFIPSHPSPDKKADILSISEVLELDDSSKDSSGKLSKIQPSISSRTSATSNSTRLSRTLHEAIGSPYHPISFKVLGLLIIVLFLSILISQIMMKVIMDQETGNLEVKKGILRSAERRNDYLVNINRRYRYFDGAIKGYYTTADFSISRLLGFAIPNTSSLAQENADLMRMARVLSEENQGKLFEKNVRVYRENVSTKYTSLQATDQIVQASLKVISVSQEDLTKAKEELDFIFKNGVNDLLLVGEETADRYLDMINLQTRVLQSRIAEILFVGLGFISVIGTISLFLIHREHKNETKNLTAFVKVNKKGVAIVSTKMSYFTKLLEDEVHFEDVKDASLLNNSGMLDNYGKLKMKVKEEVQIPLTNATKRKYRFMMLKEVLLLGVLMGLIGLMVSLVNSSIHMFSKTLNQLYFLDRMNYQFDLTTSTYFDLLVENGTSYVRNELSPVAFQNGIKTVSDIQSSIAQQLKNHDGTYDAMIESILFDNACNLLAVPDSTNCMKGGGKAGFIQLLSNFESVLNNMLNQYEQSDKSSSSLAKLILTTDIPNSMRAITFIYQVMAKRLNESFSEQIDDYEVRKLQMVIIICIMTALVCIFKYVTILRELEWNLFQFRKALRLFPPRLILSNFMLKVFLIKTTNGSFNWFKSDL